MFRNWSRILLCRVICRLQNYRRIGDRTAPGRCIIWWWVWVTIRRGRWIQCLLIILVLWARIVVTRVPQMQRLFLWRMTEGFVQLFNRCLLIVGSGDFYRWVLHLLLLLSFLRKHRWWCRCQCPSTFNFHIHLRLHCISFRCELLLNEYCYPHKCFQPCFSSLNSRRNVWNRRQRRV